MDERTADLLATLRDVEPAHSSTVDIGRAIRTGRRSTATRRTVGIAVAACLTVAIALGIPALLPGSHRTTPARPTPQTFNVLRQAVTVGTAGGYTPVTYQTGRAFQRAYLKSTGTTPGLPEQAVVTLYAKGQLPRPGWTPGTDGAPSVNGHRAYYQRNPVPGDGTEVAWQWKPGAWAFARIDGTGFRSQVGKLADGVQPANIPVRFPYTVGKSSGDLVGVLRSVDETQVTMLLAGPDPAHPVLAGTTQDITADPYTGRAMAHPPTATVALPGQWTAYAYAPGAQQQPTALAHSIRLVSHADDRTSWVANPFR